MSHGVLMMVIFIYCTANVYQMAQPNPQRLILSFTPVILTMFLCHILILEGFLLFCNLRENST